MNEFHPRRVSFSHRSFYTIALLLEEDEEADLLFYALKKAAPAIEDWLNDAK